MFTFHTKHTLATSEAEASCFGSKYFMWCKTYEIFYI